jgi:hypothetical protein
MFEGLSGTNTTAYCNPSCISTVKSFLTLPPKHSLVTILLIVKFLERAEAIFLTLGKDSLHWRMHSIILRPLSPIMSLPWSLDNRTVPIRCRIAQGTKVNITLAHVGDIFRGNARDYVNVSLSVPAYRHTDR